MKLLNKLKRIILLKKEMYAIPFSDKIKPSNFVDEAKYKTLFNSIKSEHKVYIEHISSPEMAMSLELAYFIMNYCIEYKPKRLLDLGSGFSSFVFRMYQNNFKEMDIIVYSIDDNNNWLIKTKDYLNKQNLKIDNLHNLEDFKILNLKEYFDLILLDLNFVEIRKEYLNFSMNLLSKNGLLIVDDVHKVEFLREVKKAAKINEFKLSNIKLSTIDKLGRFAIALIK